MASEQFNALNITSITVTWDVEDIWKLSFDGTSSSSFVLSDHIFHLYMRRYELSIAVYLCRDDAIPAVMPILCKLSMLDHIGQEKLIGEKEVVVDKEKEFVLLESVMISDLERQKEEFLSADTFTICCSLSTSYRLKLLKRQMSEEKPTINRFEKLSSDMENFYKSQKNTDAVLKAENTEFSVHRAILCARSPELASMLNADPQNKCLVIPDCPSSVLEDILKYIYTGKIRLLSSESAVQVLAVANRYSICELKELCLKFLGSNLTEDNVFNIAVLAFEYGDLLLREEVEQYFVQHITTILPSEKWKDFCSERYKFANEMLTAVLLKMKSTSEGKKEH